MNRDLVWLRFATLSSSGVAFVALVYVISGQAGVRDGNAEFLLAVLFVFVMQMSAMLLFLGERVVRGTSRPGRP